MANVLLVKMDVIQSEVAIAEDSEKAEDAQAMSIELVPEPQALVATTAEFTVPGLSTEEDLNRQR